MQAGLLFSFLFPFTLQYVWVMCVYFPACTYLDEVIDVLAFEVGLEIPAE